MNEDYLETIREQFFAMANIDLANIDPEEVHQLLELLPEALMYLHKQYFMPSIYKNANVKYMIKKATQ